MKTIEEVEALKKNWENDPCWDIEATEGFEEYIDQLRVFRFECEKKWELEYERKRQLDFRNASAFLKSGNSFDGLTKFELYTAMARQGLIQSRQIYNPDYIAERAIEYANSLIRAMDTLE